MRKLSLLFIILISLLLILAVVPAAASSPPLDVEFEVTTSWSPDGDPSFGPFEASGPAVDEGIVCASGDTIDVFGKASGFDSQRGFNLQLVKLFTCGDGSGTFLVKLQVRIDYDEVTSFNWVIVGGTDAYEKLHGTGSGVGLPLDDPYMVLDVYTGKVHID